MEMDEKLLQKYNTPVPRYTSYPPANYFNNSCTEREFLEAVKKSNGWEPESVSLYFHIPFCKKMCFYCGCNSCLLSDTESVEAYFRALKNEMGILAGLIDPSRKVTQVHLGGGTPNAVLPDYITRLMDSLRRNFTLGAYPETAIECNPAYLDFPYLKQLLDSGFNRFSFGVQDFNLQVLKNVNRTSSYLPVEDLISYLRSESKHVSVNLDFIYGLPGQTVKSFTNTIRKAIDTKPDRLVTFSYAHVPWVNETQKNLEKMGLPGNKEKATMYSEARNMLLDSGYRAIGLDHFVLEDDELNKALESERLHRNFQGYCTRETTGQVYAFGVSAISQLQRVYAQNTKSVGEYTASLLKNSVPVRKGYLLDDDEIIIREVITQLMCNRQLTWSRLASHLNLEVEEIKKVVGYNRKVLDKFKEDGIIEFTDDRISVTDKGSMFIRNIAASFDPLMSAAGRKFSRSV